MAKLPGLSSPLRMSASAAAAGFKDSGSALSVVATAKEDAVVFVTIEFEDSDSRLLVDVFLLMTKGRLMGRL